MTTAVHAPRQAERSQQRYLNRKRRDLNRLHGVPNRYDPAKAIEHLTLLRRTMSWAQIAEAAGSSACYLRNIHKGRVPQINGHTQRKILAVQPAPQAAPGLYIDATPYVRRVRALMAAGHSQQAIAVTAGTTQYRISLLSRGQARIRIKLAKKITAAYEQLAHTRGTSARARTVATRAGWRDPQYWDDMGHLDDPDFNPDEAERPLKRDELAALRRDEIEHLTSFGIPEHDIAKRLGIGEGTAKAILTELRTGKRRDRSAKTEVAAA